MPVSSIKLCKKLQKNINDNYEKIVLTTDELFKNTDDEGIKIINVIDWLLSYYF